MTAEPLDSIGQRQGTDKSSAHHDYLRHYESYLRLQTNPIQTLLEIGVYDGASLRTWHEFLPDTRIVGIDIDPRCKAFEDKNVTVELCDQSDVTQLTRIGVNYGPFDVVIDDGSHIWSHQILSFETIFPFVRSGGLFIIEDIDTSYGHYTAAYGRDSTITAAQYVTKLANYVLAHTAANLGDEVDLRIRTFVPQIDSITFIKRSALIRRK
jgi:predicted O-methyltransferase YrrM